jgi:hypothetical protein
MLSAGRDFCQLETFLVVTLLMDVQLYFVGKKLKILLNILKCTIPITRIIELKCQG